MSLLVYFFALHTMLTDQETWMNKRMLTGLAIVVVAILALKLHLEIRPEWTKPTTAFASKRGIK
jgi:hypothetical protein